MKGIDKLLFDQTPPNHDQLTFDHDPAIEPDKDNAALAEGTKILEQHKPHKVRRHFNYDASVSRVYFSTTGDTIGRIIFILVQLLSVMVIFVLAGALARIIVERVLPFSRALDVIAPPIWQLITMLFAIIGIVFSFLFLIPPILLKTIKALYMWGIIYLVIGTVFTLTLLGLAIVVFLFDNTLGVYKTIALSFSVINVIFCVTASFIFIHVALKTQKAIEQSIVATYSL